MAGRRPRDNPSPRAAPAELKRFLVRHRISQPSWMVLVNTMAAQIRADIASGLVPSTVKNFSELHDYVDANGYGHTDAVVNGVVDWVPGVPSMRRLTWAEFAEVHARAQHVVDHWLRAGRAPAALRTAALGDHQLTGR